MSCRDNIYNEQLINYNIKINWIDLQFPTSPKIFVESLCRDLKLPKYNRLFDTLFSTNLKSSIY